jgi:hypothetical protein
MMQYHAQTLYNLRQTLYNQRDDMHVLCDNDMHVLCDTWGQDASACLLVPNALLRLARSCSKVKLAPCDCCATATAQSPAWA